MRVLACQQSNFECEYFRLLSFVEKLVNMTALPYFQKIQIKPNKLNKKRLERFNNQLSN